MAEKKRTLKLRVEEQEFNFRLIGISSHENDYRLVWAINKALSFQFTRIANLVIPKTKLNIQMEFNRYSWTEEDKYLNYMLIANRCPDGFLFPEIKNLDFLIHISGEMEQRHLADFVKKLRKISIISAIFSMDPKQLRDAAKILAQ